MSIQIWQRINVIEDRLNLVIGELETEIETLRSEIKDLKLANRMMAGILKNAYYVEQSTPMQGNKMIVRSTDFEVQCLPGIIEWLKTEVQDE